MTPIRLRFRRPSPAVGGQRYHLLAVGLAALFMGMIASTAAGQTTTAETIGTDSGLTLEVRKGRVIRLPRPAATVFVADPEIADVQAQSPSIVYLFGRRAGSTSLYAVDENDQLLLRTAVTVDHNLSGLRQAVGQMLPGARITVGTIDGSIVIDGQVQSPTQAQELRELAERFLGEDEVLLNRIRIASPTQVHLRVRVAEVSREVMKEFGINWEAILQNGDFAFGFVSGRAVTDGIGSFLRSPTGADSAFGSWEGGDDVVNAAVDALAEEGLINVMAEPNLTALSGETASFLAGGEFPIPVDSGNDGIEIEFKEFGISLAFTPTVLSSDRISLRVRPEVSDLTDKGAININGLVIPALSTRRAETTVELGSGQTFAIGGLMLSDVQSAVSKYPGLGDVPVLGALFRSTRFQSNETELVILVTPYLVRPFNEPQLAAAPTDGFRAPTDLERILFGRLHGARLHPGRAGPIGPDGERLAGPIGFVLE